MPTPAPDTGSVSSSPSPPPLDVMIRVLRLPTRSRRQARTIARLQLDRLSPLPPGEIVYDLVPLRQDGAETVFAMGILRKQALAVPELAQQGTVIATRDVEGHLIAFRFRNPGARSDLEARWLPKAPRAALILLAVAGVTLAGALRSGQWREAQLPEIAAGQRSANRVALQERQRLAALTDWTALDRTDASARLRCVLAGLGSSPLPVTALGADTAKVTITSPTQSARLRAAGGRGGETAEVITFDGRACG